MLPGWNLATKTHIACDVGVRKALHLDFETCKMYIYYGVYTHPIVNCMRVYVVMRTLYANSLCDFLHHTMRPLFRQVAHFFNGYLCDFLHHTMRPLFRQVSHFFNGYHFKCLTLKWSACFDLSSPSSPIHNANIILCKRKFHRIIL
jgi:hypothetical protein